MKLEILSNKVCLRLLLPNIQERFYCGFSRFFQSTSAVFLNSQASNTLICSLNCFLKLNKESKSDFDPKDLLTAIISKIKAINSGEDESSSELTFTGMIRLMTKIIENFDISICEEIVVREGLIEEIFVKLIFKSVFEEGEKKTSKSPSYGLKAASFKLIMYLVKSSPKLMSAFLKDCFAKLTDKFRRRTEWNYIPPQ